jgi:hypothetical protein
MPPRQIGQTATSEPDDLPPGAGDAGLAALVHRPGPGTHWTTVVVAGRQVLTLADLPPLRDRLLFVGQWPSPESVTAGHYHQDPAGRAIWQLLIEARIVPLNSPLGTADDALVARGHGLTDLVKVPGAATLPESGSPDAELADTGLAAGVGPLWQKVALWRPAAVVFIHRRGAEAAAGRPLTARWGRLPGVALAGRPCLLLPEPDLPAADVAAGVAFFRDLAGVIEGLLPTDGSETRLD